MRQGPRYILLLFLAWIVFTLMTAAAVTGVKMLYHLWKD